jgi:hypothetical protein
VTLPKQICVVCGDAFWRVPQEARTTDRPRLMDLICLECVTAAQTSDSALIGAQSALGGPGCGEGYDRRAEGSAGAITREKGYDD